ncbi:MAG: sulfate adenylyltransferase subunit CysN [Hydrogenovibrio sp.]|uniref:sulfate adenylyltransferase subunit CysN n=1 Tax=Hydrogenovibrio sp. TaxID=2065821 RepID=UPI0028702C83|nr:sulfate adenylyltransferase subunit CysN [Hydrogenovibrio sp.]MDR9499753.1 sulfate adenylyltransferase subunit CysN [Hydrogenovibrio sp.]
MRTTDTQTMDIQDYLQHHRDKSLLRILTCGSVDDGKSTLLGRLLFDSQQIYDDQLHGLNQDIKGRTADGDLELAMLVDGLQAEREQGITIDVAYRFFSTEKRKFIIADTPGHEQYTRNMVTGASTANTAILLVDARYGVQQQTRRHAFICHLLGIQQWVLAVNKMDLVDYDQAVFSTIREEIKAIGQSLGVADIYPIPLSALKGENTLTLSDKMPWYQKQPLLPYLENLPVENAVESAPNRFCVQWVNRPNLDFRGYSGLIQSGQFQPGLAIKVLPGGQTSRLKKIVTFDGDLDQAQAGQPVTFTLEDERDISRGNWIVPADEKVDLSNRLDAHLVWFDDKPMTPGQSFYIKFAVQQTQAVVSQIHHLVDIHQYTQVQGDQLRMNDIGYVHIELAESTLLDTYQKGLGQFILVDSLTNATVAAGMVQTVQAEVNNQYSSFEMELNALIRKHFPHWHARDLHKLLNDSTS